MCVVFAHIFCVLDKIYIKLYMTVMSLKFCTMWYKFQTQTKNIKNILSKIFNEIVEIFRQRKSICRFQLTFSQSSLS